MADNDSRVPEDHVGSYREAGWLLDQWVCSCGWESEVYYDGYEFAKEEWEKHVESSNSGQSVDN